MKLTRRQFPFIALASVCALLSLLCFAIPMYVIRPFRPQGATEFPFAIGIRESGPTVSVICLLIVLTALILAWPRTRMLARAALMLCAIAAVAGAALTRINIFEMMFHPYGAAAFTDANSLPFDPNQMLMSVSLGGENHAYPIGAMGYHHVVNDTVGGVPVIATYCTLCHTGIVWKRAAAGRILTFRLAGIRNGNALLRDEEIGSIWQQTTGIAIFGPLKGTQLELIHSDELSYALWRTEQPRGHILKPNAQFAAQYDKIGWEKSIEKLPTVIDTTASGIPPRELMVGIETGSASKAFPWTALLSAGLIQDRVGSQPVLLILGPDRLSMRAFQVPPDTTFLRAETNPNAAITDAGTSSHWNFSGCATAGPLQGQCLTPINFKKDYWFDWQNYHPRTLVFNRPFSQEPH